MLHGVGCVTAPGERTMVRHERARRGNGVDAETVDRLHYGVSRRLLVGVADAVGRNFPRNRYVVVEGVRMRGADVGNRPPRLRPRRRVGRVGVDDAPYGRERLVEDKVRGRVARRAVVPLHHLAVKVHHHHVGGLHAVIRNAARLDHHKPAFAVYFACIAPGEYGETLTSKREVGCADALLYFLQH